MKDSPLVVEPALYVFGGLPDTAPIQDHFLQFWLTFGRLRTFVDLNCLRVACTRELFDQVTTMFHYIPPGRREPPGGSHEAMGLCLDFLDRFVAPWKEYAGAEDEVVNVAPRCLPHIGVYSNDDFLMAWHDLLGQCYGSAIDLDALLLLGGPPLSFAPAGTTVLTITLRLGRLASVPAMRLDQPLAVRGFLDPDARDSLLSRRPPPPFEPDIDYEDSGHQASIPIKRILERTARDCAAFVIRMNTSQSIPVPEVCKLQSIEGRTLETRHSQIKFQVSDRKTTMKGFFTTRAQTANELRVAEVLLRREFASHCDAAGFQCRE